MSATLQAKVPDDIMTALQTLGYTPQRLSEEALKQLAAALFARKALTLEQAAKMADMSLWDFVPFLGSQNIPVSDYDSREIEIEMETAQWLSSRT